MCLAVFLLGLALSAFMVATKEQKAGRAGMAVTLSACGWVLAICSGTTAVISLVS